MSLPLFHQPGYEDQDWDLPNKTIITTYDDTKVLMHERKVKIL